MEQLLEDIGHHTHIPFSVIAGRLALATTLGAVVGFEREWRQRPAGLRTHILVCLAAALVAILTIEIAHVSYFEGDRMRLDPLRAIEAVTSGIAFLAAGLIVFARGEVHGLTTGAGMWLAGAIGLSCGLGFWGIAAFATVLAVIVLSLLRIVERKLSLKAKREREALAGAGETGPADGPARP
ncbi:MgtC/SapB family protein [Aquibium sp. ELW1220]|uniref:MgtC/SapB family protein n=1 Tax=Aquibium sp. ELW1220 TaxID=2976766 RepID=UPI0025B1A108|nr:MgtC/SapB family protein [Aquibium sp. ELW1220]MDN2582583.1 MgtC/SapB family protein [Aquibium sp. ELW1220]